MLETDLISKWKCGSRFADTRGKSLTMSLFASAISAALRLVSPLGPLQLTSPRHIVAPSAGDRPGYSNLYAH